METALALIEDDVYRLVGGGLNVRWLSLRLLEEDDAFNHSLAEYLGFSLSDDESFQENLTLAKQVLSKMGLSKNKSATCSFQKLFVKARQSTATAYRWKKGITRATGVSTVC